MVTASVDPVNEARTLRPQLSAAVLITKKTARTTIGAGARETLTQSGLPILRTELCYRVSYQEAPAAGLGPTVYDPTGPAAAEVRSLANELDTLLLQEDRRAVA